MVVHCAAPHDSWRGQPNQAAATAAWETAALDLHKVLEKIQTGHPDIYLYMYMYMYIQGVQEKLCFFTIHCNPSLAFVAVRDLQSSQRNASVQSLLLAGNFLYNQ